MTDTQRKLADVTETLFLQFNPFVSAPFIGRQLMTFSLLKKKLIKHIVLKAAVIYTVQGVSLSTVYQNKRLFNRKMQEMM